MFVCKVVANYGVSVLKSCINNSIFFDSLQLFMERRDVILTAVLSTVFALLLLVGALAACYWWHRRKRKRDGDDGSDVGDSGGARLEAPPAGKEGRVNGFLSLKTPLISTKTLG